MDILQKYAPIVFFDKRERNFPCSMKHFVEVSVYNDEKGSHWFDLDGFNNYINYNNTNHGELLPLKDIFPPEDLASVPVYSFGRLIKDDLIDTRTWYYELNYAFLYVYNGNIFCIPCIKVGTHYGDWEHITIQVDYVSQKVTRVFFARHANEGKWIDSEKLNFSNSRVHVYAGRESHASYQKSGTTWRLFGFANDNHRGGGAIWKPKVSPILADGSLIESEQIIKRHKNTWARQYHGKFGTISPLYNRHWFKKDGEASKKPRNPCWPCWKC